MTCVEPPSDDELGLEYKWSEDGYWTHDHVVAELVARGYESTLKDAEAYVEQSGLPLAVDRLQQ